MFTTVRTRPSCVRMFHVNISARALQSPGLLGDFLGGHAGSSEGYSRDPMRNSVRQGPGVGDGLTVRRRRGSHKVDAGCPCVVRRMLDPARPSSFTLLLTE